MKSDKYYFEQLTFILFTTVIGPLAVEKRWRSIKESFSNFSIRKVSSYSDARIERIAQNPHVIRNIKKIRATVLNAQAFLRIKDEFGSFNLYLTSFDDDDALIDDLRARLHYVGKPSIREFLDIILPE